MLWKQFVLFFFTCFINSSESAFKKTLHAYVGLNKLFRQAASTEIEYKVAEIEDEENGSEDNNSENNDHKKQIAEGELNNQINYELVLIHNPEKAEDHLKKLVTILNNNKEKMCKKYGFVFSIYLGEFMDIISFGICVAHENYTEDIITYNPNTNKMINAKASKDEDKKISEDTKKENKTKKKSKKKKKNKKENEKENNEKQEGCLFLKRQIPFMIGAFAQIQNDDLESYFVAGKIDIMVGLLRVFGQSKEVSSYINNNLINTNSILLKNTPVIALTLTVVLRILDLEVALMMGVRWAPMGIKAKQTGFPKEEVTDGEIENNTEINIKTNHLEVFIGISIGFSF